MVKRRVKQLGRGTIGTIEQVSTLIVILFIAVFCSCSKPESNLPAAKNAPKHRTIDFGFDLLDYNVVRDTIEQGETFGSILSGQNLGDHTINKITTQIKDSLDLRSIRKGNPLTLLRTLDREKKLQAIVFQPNQRTYYVIDLRDTILVYKKMRPFVLKKRTIAGQLDGSISEALAAQKADPELASRITKIYQWTIDFFKLQKGAKFAVTFTERYINDSIYDGVDSLYACFFEYKGKPIYAFPFALSPNLKTEYYDQDAKPLKNFFLKAPLKFSRITSRFSPNRFHPVQMIWKAHKGTDYAAPHGTPIMTTAAGVVEAAGYTAGNGNFVKVKHNNMYATQYLHMSKILVKVGQRVNQGDIIGKVGSTGLATGPHVCYRFWKNGQQVDPLRENLPHAESISIEHKTEFLRTIAPLKKQLDSISALKFK